MFYTEDRAEQALVCCPVFKQRHSAQFWTLVPEQYTFTKRSSATSDVICFVSTGFLSGVVVVFSEVIPKEPHNPVDHLIQDNSLECVALLVWCGVSPSELDGLSERRKVFFLLCK